jgi:hypothetical protein
VAPIEHPPIGALGSIHESQPQPDCEDSLTATGHGFPPVYSWQGMSFLPFHYVFPGEPQPTEYVMKSSRNRLKSLAIALVALIPCALAQAGPIESYSLNFENIRFDYAPAKDERIPFGIDLTIQADGSVDAVFPGTIKHSDVTLKRGVVGASAPGTATFLDFSIEQSLPQFQVLGRLGIETRGSAGIDLDIQDASRLSYVADADALVMHMSGEDFGDRIVLVFQAGPDTRLTGIPAAVFGPPGTGKTLSAVLLAPPAGREIEMVLEVRDQLGSGIQVPIRIKHNL